MNNQEALACSRWLFESVQEKGINYSLHCCLYFIIRQRQLSHKRHIWMNRAAELEERAMVRARSLEFPVTSASKYFDARQNVEGLGLTYFEVWEINATARSPTSPDLPCAIVHISVY